MTDCIHRGAKIGKTLCEGCRGRVELTVYACTVHERCTVGKPAKDAACCKGCESYDLPQTAQIKTSHGAAEIQHG